MRRRGRRGERAVAAGPEWRASRDARLKIVAGLFTRPRTRNESPTLWRSISFRFRSARSPNRIDWRPIKAGARRQPDVTGPLSISRLRAQFGAVLRFLARFFLSQCTRSDVYLYQTRRCLIRKLEDAARRQKHDRFLFCFVCLF